MEQKKQICISDELATLPSDYPWLVAHNLDPEEDDTGDQVFFTLHDPMSRYRCRIPELIGRTIRGCFHGWMILSKRNPQGIEWSLWNPVISKLIRLPRLTIPKDKDDDFRYCCLSSPPDDPGSILLLMTSTEPNIVFFFCNDKRKKTLRRWTEKSYSKHIKSISGGHDRTLLEPTCCNGNIYAWSHIGVWPPSLIQVKIDVVKKKKVVMNLVPLVKLPDKYRHCDCLVWNRFFLKGTCTQLFTIQLCVHEDKPFDVRLFELDMCSMVWIEIEDLKGTVFFASMADDQNDSVYNSPPIASELGGGYIHIIEESGNVIYSYNIKDKTISMSSMHRLTELPLRKSISIWTIPEFRLHGKPTCNDHGDHDQMVTSATDDDDDDDEVEQMNEARLQNIPFDVLENIMKFCFGVDYLNFRATCKLCRLAAPMEKYSLASPWLMVLDKDRGIITFTDPMFGDNNYFIKASPELSYPGRILCSRYGWLLFYIACHRIAFFNPFTRDIRELPQLEPSSGLEMVSFCFSAPPTSPDCMVVAFSIVGEVCFHRVGREPMWHEIPLNVARDDAIFFWFPTFCGEDVYTLFNKGGGLEVFRGIDDRDNFSWKHVVDEASAPSTSTSAEYYQVKCNQHHLLVMVEKCGESVEVFKLSDSTQKWEKIDDLGSHMIYICDASCVCMEAKIPEMANKIYFPRVYSENGKIVFYSLKTCGFHTFNGRNVEQNLIGLFGTKQTVYVHAWIEPAWS